MKHLLMIALLLTGAAESKAQFLNFGRGDFGGGRGIGAGGRSMVFHTPGATGRFRSNMWLNLNTRSGARVMAPYNYRSDRFGYGGMYLVPNSYWGWQDWNRHRTVEEEDFELPVPQRDPNQTGWRKYLRN